MADKKITLSADGATATVADATLTDVFTTMISTNTFVSGTYGLIQKAGFVLGGMAFQNSRKVGTWNPLA